MLPDSTLEASGIGPLHRKRHSISGTPDISSAAGRTESRMPHNVLRDRMEDTGSDTAEVSQSGVATPTMSGHGFAKVPEESPVRSNNIQEGLGNLNRWSQSTTSSKGSPRNIARRSLSIVSLGDKGGNPLGRMSPASTTEPQFFMEYNNHNPHSKEPTASRNAELTRLQLPEIGISATLSTGMVDSASWRPDSMPSGTTSNSDPLFQDPWFKDKNAISSDSVNSLLEISSGHAQGVEYALDANSSLPSGSKPYQDKRRRGHAQKAMLSKALQKANTAVLLDNAANFEGAMEAYNDACQLLQLVMLRSNGGEDERLKLQEIRDTYMIRVNELERMDFSFREADTKALPQRPLSQESYAEIFQAVESTPAGSLIGSDDPGTITSNQIPPRRQSLLPSGLDGELYVATFAATSPPKDDVNLQGTARRDSKTDNMTPPPGSDHVPKPLDEDETRISTSRYSELSILSAHARDIYESTSWLDTIDESGASSPTSVMSKESSVYLRQRRSHRLSHGTEAEFDAALDAAVEAAYDEGLEPAVDHEIKDCDDDIVANARRNVELAKQRVREAEREAEVAMTRGRELRRLQEQAAFDNSIDIEPDYLDEEAEEEERLLEEMTRGYVMDDFEFDLQSKSALPRQSDSSSFSGRTWGSSAASNTTTGAPAAALSPLAEDSVLPTIDTKMEQKDLSSPKDPHAPTPPAKPSFEQTVGTGVRARRMSSQNLTELTIETNSHTEPSPDILNLSQSPDQFRPEPLPKDDLQTSLAPQELGAVPGVTLGMLSEGRKEPVEPILDELKAHESLSNDTAPRDEDRGSRAPSPTRLIGKVPSAPDNLGRISSGLKPFRARNVSVPVPDPTANSPDTPLNTAFPIADLQKGTATAAVPILPTPTGATFAPNGLPSGGLYLFDSHIHSPTSLGSPNLMAANAPLPLEPCPESFLLRPFWLMRCIYQTVAHPRGGYLTTKLFIPRDIWRVKNVKLKAVEEKVSNCDLLTAALLKLAKVDTYDADAVLEEMQSLESVLDQVQTSLSKKIGGEVGVQGAMPLFKTSQVPEDSTTVEALPAKTSSGQSKSYLSSWRKLRSKNSGIGATASPPGAREATGKENLTIGSLPMTPVPNSQPRRNTSQLQYNGPNSNYMGALARLCDAAQVLDQIAQQVEDPGLKHSSPTLVGLELSTRHAAEFFGFYVCRFVLNDIGMMLDKFIKRGSEWVLI